MAKDTAKKHWKSNEERLKFFQFTSLAILAVDVLVAVLFSNSGVTWGWTFMLAFWAGQYYITLRLLYFCGQPTFHETSGELIDCIDLKDPEQLGVYSYAQDLLWVCWVVETLSLYSWWGLVLYAPVPMVVTYKAWSMLLSPMISRFFSSGRPSAGQDDKSAAEADPRTRLQRRREELRARKGKS
mmetsp:Transcript_49714/g.57258  ORF Transcript_49714/g.57258 Transcript_49714/m.57258 type:complete len:184 (-) Transcript_49714:42-593(-)|eukprot:CAMPEP_0176448746 /NCGR_PEP_ID=MMETSP0127-20121128/26003_1 /TAXON_ID=938130 /ORGANISM="Platyophrya macrostoma, Strain WH" /LENGTH=183 /DNA_ID=CAMNT_0017835827 /DNA_START=6 /DNA_END=557 /DNA_ORIENTATION=+